MKKKIFIILMIFLLLSISINTFSVSAESIKETKNLVNNTKNDDYDAEVIVGFYAELDEMYENNRHYDAHIEQFNLNNKRIQGKTLKVNLTIRKLFDLEMEGKRIKFDWLAQVYITDKILDYDFGDYYGVIDTIIVEWRPGYGKEGYVDETVSIDIELTANNKGYYYLWCEFEIKEVSEYEWNETKQDWDYTGSVYSIDDPELYDGVIEKIKFFEKKTKHQSLFLDTVIERFPIIAKLFSLKIK